MNTNGANPYALKENNFGVEVIEVELADSRNKNGLFKKNSTKNNPNNPNIKETLRTLKNNINPDDDEVIFNSQANLRK